MSTFQIANDLATVAPGTNPKTVYFVGADYSTLPATFDPADGEGLPGDLGRGEALPDNTITALIGIDLRENIAGRTARVTIGTFDVAAEYTIELDGTSVATVAQPYADVPEALTALGAAIDADVTLAALVTTGLEDADGDGILDTLIIVGKAEADYVVDALSATLTGTLDLVADAASLEFEVFFVRGGVNSNSNPRPNGWRKIPLAGGVSVIPVDTKGYEERYIVSGERRVAVTITNVIASGDVAAGGSLLTVTHTYAAHVGYGITPGTT